MIARKLVCLLVPSLFLAPLPACGGSGGGGGNKLADVPGLGAMLADESRERMYLSSGTTGQLVALSTRTGEIVAELNYPVPVGGLALDGCSRLLFAAIPGGNRIDVIDCETFTVTDTWRINADPRSLEWLDEETMLIFSGSGLYRGTPGRRKLELLHPEITEDAIHVLDITKRYLVIAQTVDDRLELFRYDLVREDALVAAIDDWSGKPIGLHVSHDLRELYFATDGPDGIYVLRPDSLELLETTGVGPGITAMAVNRSSTRMYLAHGGALISSLNLHNYNAGKTYLFSAAVLGDNLTVSATAQLLVAGLTDDSVESVPLFPFEVVGNPTSYLGQPYELVLRGPYDPEYWYFFILSARVGYLFLDDPDGPDPRFLETAFPGFIPGQFAGPLTPSGERSFPFYIPDDLRLLGEEIVIQAASAWVWDAGGRELDDVSNPLVLRIQSPDCNPAGN